MPRVYIYLIASIVAVASVKEVCAFQLQPRRTFPTSLHSAYYSVAETAVNIDESTPREIQAMEEWAESCGVQKAEGFQLTCDDEYGLDVYAMTTENLPANSNVLFVPEQMILSSNKAIEELRTEEMEKIEEFIFDFEAESELRHYYLTLKILVEYEKGEDSPWFPWLNSMPRYYSNAASMTPFCYQCLPSLMRKLAMEERANLNHLSVKKVPFLSIETRGNADLWTFAHQIVYTRAFEADDGSGDLRIVPMGDYLNHGTKTEVEFAYDDEGNYWARSVCDVPAGSPLRVSYADPTNPSFLFARYGFIDESSPSTFCKIFPPQVNRDMLDLGYAQNRMLFFKESGDASQEVWDILLYQLLSSKNMNDRRILLKAHQMRDVQTKLNLHEKYYSDTSAMLKEHIDTFLGRLERLTQKAEGMDPSEHPRLPLILSHNEFVKQTFLSVRRKYFG
mmetsp:Transcript_8549/g.11784  ORF Transcript_8549/g.11784 Transcript_8549/m.11784 type:complete len:449 (-) Transcript_8549:271-1617(-)